MNHQINTKATLWENVHALMLKHWGEENQSRLAKVCGVGLGTIARIKQQQTSVGLDVIERIAEHFHISPWQLLVPGMDAKNPPTLQPVNEKERRLYEKIMNAAREIAAEPDSKYLKDLSNGS
jgi:transcriptional regulator with XRE-family HTH domain